MGALSMSTLGIQHFIITRFNVQIYPKPFELRLYKDWLLLRFDLFQRFCLPSILSQKTKDFTWLVLFDARTPPFFLNLIKAYARKNLFVPVFCESHADLVPSVVNAIGQRLRPETRWLLTTRFDNDDALAVHFNTVLHSFAEQYDQQRLEQQQRVYLNLHNGLQWHEGVVYDFKDPCNAFVSLLEPAVDIKTVFWVGHPNISKVADVAQIFAAPLWLQTIHDFNVYNYIRGVPYEDYDLEAHFRLHLN